MTEKKFPYELPENWHWTTLGEIAEIIMGQSPNGNDTTNDSTYTPLIGGAADMGNLFPKITRYTQKPTKLSKPNDIIICVRATLGNPIFSDKEYCLGRGVAAIRLSSDSKIFLRYVLINFEQYFFDNANGSTFKQISSEKLKKFPIPLPPIDEQKKIVERIESLFSKLDSAKSIVQKILDGYELRRSAILHKAFTGELTKNFRAKNNLSLDDWQEKTLGEVCKINPPKISTANLSDDLKVSFFPMTSLSETEGKITDPQIKFLGEVKSGYTNFSEGDVVFAKITPCMENGKSAVIEKLVNDIGYGTTEFFVLRCNKEIFNRFLYHLVRSKKFRTEAKEVMAGAVGQQRVPKKFLSEYKISLPPLAEQKEIVRVLDSLLDKEQRTKEIVEKILSDIDLLKKSVLARAFRGEL